VQLALTTIKVAAIVLLVGLLLWFGGSAHRALPRAGTPPAVPLSAYGLAIAAGLFSFGGWHMVTYAAGETRDPEHTIPRALMLGTLIVTGCYVLLNAGYLYVLPMAEVAHSTRVAADATSHALGAGAGGAIAVLVVISSLGSDNGIILAGPRVYYAMARDGLAFRWMGAVHPRRQTPHLAILAQAVVASLLVATNSYRELFTRVVYTEWLFFALLAAGLFVLHRRGEFRPRYLRQAYPWVPAVFIVASATIAVEQIAANPRGSALGLGLILLGIPVYLVWKKKAGGSETERATGSQI
jgi:APA family basic amino acid/polyamine antiporter